MPVEKLLVSQKLSRELCEYSSPSPAARAVRQMQAAGKVIRPGQSVRFLFTLGKPGVQAWDVPQPPDPRTVDLPRYRTLFQRAVGTVLAPIQQSVGAALHLDARLGQADIGVRLFKTPTACDLSPDYVQQPLRPSPFP